MCEGGFSGIPDITGIALQSKSQSGYILGHHNIPRTHTGKLLVNFVPFFPHRVPLELTCVLLCAQLL